jgi:hypothetical protein
MGISTSKEKKTKLDPRVERFLELILEAQRERARQQQSVKPA